MKKLFLLVPAFLLVALSAQASNTQGTLQEYIAIGKVLSVGLNTSPSGWVVSSNNNAAIASASIQGNSLIIDGISSGVTTVLACTNSQSTNCLAVNVTVGGSVLGASITAHTAGSWVIDGKTVYYINQDGIIPITTWKIFLNNGGKSSLIQKSNAADLNLSLLPFMTLNDSRVK